MTNKFRFMLHLDLKHEYEPKVPNPDEQAFVFDFSLYVKYASGLRVHLHGGSIVCYYDAELMHRKDTHPEVRLLSVEPDYNAFSIPQDILQVLRNKLLQPSPFKQHAEDCISDYWGEENIETMRDRF